MMFAAASVGLSGTLRVTLRNRLSSGLPFTPMVAGDVNGDGSTNDHAFIFDPRLVTDEAVGAGMGQLLAHSPARIRECLSSQTGRIAAYNSCRAGWSSNLTSI